VFLIGVLTGWWMYRLRPRWGMVGTAAGISAFIAAAGLLPVVREFAQALAPTLDSSLLRGPVMFFLFVQPHIWFALLAALLCIALTHRASVVFTNAAITSLGRCSFSIYLVHFALLHPVHSAVGSLTTERGAGFLALYYASLLACSWAVAAVSYRFVEVPFIQLGRRLSLSSGLPRLAPHRQS
jgi:peptidoglycan/LPS O-acetylase OafA/YrhL